MTCLFCQIIAGELPTTTLYEDNKVLVFRDIAPQAPTHALVIPKRHISTINDATDADAQLLGHMILVAQNVAKNENLDDGYRLVFNVNKHGGQTVYHIHLHLLGGRQLTWPPG